LSEAAAAGPVPLRRAGLLRRLGAVAYEGLLLTALLFVTAFVLLPVVSPGSSASAGALTVPAAPARVLLFCTLFAVAAAYFVWSWTGGRRTLPMKTWRLRIVAAGDCPPSRKTALARYLAAWIGPVLAVVAFAALERRQPFATASALCAANFLWAFVDSDRQFLHDRIAGTRIVRDG
jgi:uncharacterized RDD family membrane protein YckC